MIKLNRFTKKLYRKKVIGLIKNNKDKFLIDQLTDYGKNDWNFPGGGVNKGEKEEEALLRELREELGTDKFKILKKSKDTVTYNWPLRVIIRRYINNNGFWLGQTQRHFLVQFLGKSDDIKLDPVEIRKIKWIKEKEFKNYLNFKNQLIETKEEIINLKNTSCL